MSRGPAPTSEVLDHDEEGSLRHIAREVLRDPGSTRSDFARLGWLGLLAPEPAGSGWQPVAATVVAEEAGRALAPAPLISHLLAVGLLTRIAGVGDRSPTVDALVGGRIAAVLARGTFERDGSAHAVTGVVNGPGATDADCVVVLDDASDRVLILDRPTPGFSPEPCGAPAGTERPWWQARLVQVEATEIALSGSAQEIALLPDLARVLAAADALGTLSGARRRLTRYLSERCTFGRPVAANQVVQHRLVDLYLTERRMRSLVRVAAATIAARHADAPRAAAAASVYAAEHAVEALDECMHLSGAIGFTWEYPLHRELRRAAVDRELFGSSRAQRHRYLILAGWDGQGGQPAPRRCEWSLPTAERGIVDAYRSHVRQVIARWAPSAPAREGHRAPTGLEQEQELRRWFAALYSEGLLGQDWPSRYGGAGHEEPWRRRVVTEEILRARAPRPVDQTQLAASVLLRHGSADQRDRYLPLIRSGAHVWCQLLSEPDAGSDIAAVRTRGGLRPDGSVVVSGHKIWITDAHWADMGLALVRTDSRSTRHRGLTTVLVPMAAAGVTVRPIRTINGAAEINEVFLDDVAVPADDVVGPLGGGWSVIMAGLDGERFGVGANVVLLDQLLEDLRVLACGLTVDRERAVHAGDVRQRATSLLLEAAAAAALADAPQAPEIAGPGDAAALKLSFSEAYHGISAYGSLLGHGGDVTQPDAAAALGRLWDSWLWSRAYTVSAGSSEMMRDILARRTLGLPSSTARSAAGAPDDRSSLVEAPDLSDATRAPGGTK